MNLDENMNNAYSLVSSTTFLVLIMSYGYIVMEKSWVKGIK